jgi:D-alanyl-D-alanine carboxypeptidase
MRKRLIKISAVISTALIVTSQGVPAHALTVPANFVKLASSPTLNHPGIILVDPNTKETIFSDAADVRRAPASLLKLFSMTAVLNTFSPEKTYTTTISSTTNPHNFVVLGESDPWITASALEADKYHRSYSPSLIKAVLKENPKLRYITLEYSGVYTQDLEKLVSYYRGKVRIHLKQLASPLVGKSLAVMPIEHITSPKLSDIVQYCLLWSDNVLADRLARTAAVNMGFLNDTSGIQSAFEKVMTQYNIPADGLLIEDGNGLSHKTRMTTRQIADLLVVIRDNPQYKIIYDGLPLAGVSGTLKDRFVTDAPNAIGLVKAKTGTLSTTISMAGYVTVGSEQYVFAIVADHIRKHFIDAKAAMVTIDKMLGTIAHA